jgi:hypothetical protein
MRHDGFRKSGPITLLIALNHLRVLPWHCDLVHRGHCIASRTFGGLFKRDRFALVAIVAIVALVMPFVRDQQQRSGGLNGGIRDFFHDWVVIHPPLPLPVSLP